MHGMDHQRPHPADQREFGVDQQDDDPPGRKPKHVPLGGIADEPRSWKPA